MPICESIKTNNCMHPPYYVALTESFKQCVGSCNQVEYNGHVSKWYYTENVSENTALWNLVFSSKNIATEKESLGILFESHQIICFSFYMSFLNSFWNSGDHWISWWKFRHVCWIFILWYIGYFEIPPIQIKTYFQQIIKNTYR